MVGKHGGEIFSEVLLLNKIDKLLYIGKMKKQGIQVGALNDPPLNRSNIFKNLYQMMSLYSSRKLHVSFRFDSDVSFNVSGRCEYGN